MIEDSERRIIFFTYKPRKEKLKWTQTEDKLLIDLSQKFNFKTKWVIISKYFDNRSSIDCFCRYKLINPSIHKGRWTKEECDKVIELKKMYGNNWSKISKMIKTRTPKQIRSRFINYLDEKLDHSEFSSSEDNIMKIYFPKLGRYSTRYVKHLQNRSPKMIQKRLKILFKI